MRAARTLNRYQVGEDGKTAYRRWKGKDFKREVAEIGETVLYLKAGTQGKNKFNPRWEKGIWLGIDETSEIIVGTETGIVKAKDFKRLADELTAKEVRENLLRCNNTFVITRQHH